MSFDYEWLIMSLNMKVQNLSDVFHWPLAALCFLLPKYVSIVFRNHKYYICSLQKKKERQKENKRKRKESHIQKNKRKMAKSSKITSLEKTPNSMLANIFLDIFMWITILYKHIIVCILLYNLLFTKYHGSFGQYQWT